MYQSESIAALAASLCDFQRIGNGAAKNAVNPHLKNKYADLASIWDAVRDGMTANGLSVVQLPMPSDPGTLKLRTQLNHMTGEWMASEIVMPLAKCDPQGYGSALTYARRYALAAMLGVIQEDDDGHAATRRDQAPEAGGGGGGGRRLTDKQVALAKIKLKEAALEPSDAKRICAENGLPESLTGMWTAAQFEALLSLIDAHAA